MKILLLGDFSGVHLNLKKGLDKLGHEVTLVSKGDGFKNLESDIRVFNRKPDNNKIVGATKEILNQLKLYPKLKNFDVLQTASTQFFHNRIDKLLFNKLLNSYEKKVLLNTACSVPYNQFVKKLDYSPCTSCKKFDLPNHKCVHEKKEQEKIEYKLYEKYSSIVSTHFEYFQSFNNTKFKDKNKLILLPIDTEKHKYNFPSTKNKLKIYYGEIRKGFKGGEIIEDALNLLEESKYKSEIEIIRTQKLSFNEYINILNNSHIVIDQINSYSYGMNALIGLSKGKIVLSGNEPTIYPEMNMKSINCPIINLKPNKEYIFNCLISLIENKDKLIELSEKGRVYVEKHHSVIQIAKQYENIYTNI